MSETTIPAETIPQAVKEELAEQAKKLNSLQNEALRSGEPTISVPGTSANRTATDLGLTISQKPDATPMTRTSPSKDQGTTK